jgi:prepilin-type N-terminal cleavage/methylation domain-containing protein
MKRGTTLVELLVVLCVLGVLGAVALVDLRRSSAYPVSTMVRAARQVDSMRGVTLRSGRERTVVIEDSSGAHTVTLLPDGSIIADSVFGRELGLDRLTGRTRVPVGRVHR